MITVLLSGRTVASPREDAIKSGFLYNFARYSQGDWFNAELQPRYNICSFDPQFVDIARQTLKARTIKKVLVTVHLLSTKFDSIADCNTLYLTKNDVDEWLYLINNVTLSKMMLVGEFNGFIESGGHINFFIVGGKVRFEVNIPKLKASGIYMSSKVLRLGRIHKGDNE
ncbi:YfiR family protein [Psychromonas sp.]|uniref:YfiR family protein n=1 Tax=Psychromonas sp. TaxID=1884585 RepID=UPI0039E6DF83